MKIDIGCGPNKREGYLGVDLVDLPGVDYPGVDFERDRLPFEDDSVDRVFSAHTIEHIEHPMNLLREVLRVCKHGALVEVWMPYGHSDDAFILGHRVFYTPEHWRHFVVSFPETWLGPLENGRFRWKRLRYNLRQDFSRETMERLSIPLEFAVRHLNNVAWEFGVLLEVDKRDPAAAMLVGQPSPEIGYGRV